MLYVFLSLSTEFKCCKSCLKSSTASLEGMKIVMLDNSSMIPFSLSSSANSSTPILSMVVGRSSSTTLVQPGVPSSDLCENEKNNSSKPRGPSLYYVSKGTGCGFRKMANLAKVQCYLCWRRVGQKKIQKCGDII